VATTTAAAPTTLTTPNTSTSALIKTSSNGSIVTSTSVVAVTPTATSGGDSSSKGFFQNTGAVAGVFTVVGLAVLAIFIYFLTKYLKRRREKQLDRDTDEAAAAGPDPMFFDDDDDRNDHYNNAQGYGNGYGHGAGNGGGYPDVNYAGAGAGGAGGIFSDASSHGTYAQQPLSVEDHTESYGMRELGNIQPASYGYANAAYANGYNGGYQGDSYGYATGYDGQDQGQNYYHQDTTTVAPTPVRAPSSQGHHQQQQSSLSHSNSLSQQPQSQHDGYYRGPGSPEHGLLEAAGLVGGAATVGRGMSLSHHDQAQSVGNGQYHPYDQQQQHQQQQHIPQALVAGGLGVHHEEDAYGG
ncbi:hypothetical protein H0H93_013710, partial [Arthromyces matolae]